jgi:hypothetical protein
MGNKVFKFLMTFNIDEDHPLYEETDREIRAELGIFMMDCMSKDPSLGYEFEVFEHGVI